MKQLNSLRAEIADEETADPPDEMPPRIAIEIPTDIPTAVASPEIQYFLDLD
ncbi:MAG: hypothetical protein WCF22_10830 [Candidatus Sulfotelmatobacter sp.]